VKCKPERKLLRDGPKKRWLDVVEEDFKTPECEIGRESFNIAEEKEEWWQKPRTVIEVKRPAMMTMTVTSL